MERALRFPRLKQRLVRKWGSYCWQRIPEAEFERMVDGLIVNMKDRKINDERELAEFVSHESQVKGPLGLPQWRLFIKEDYQPDKSLFILKMHHVVTDGYGMSVFLANVMDTFDEQVLPHLPVLTTF